MICQFVYYIIRCTFAVLFNLHRYFYVLRHIFVILYCTNLFACYVSFKFKLPAINLKQFWHFAFFLFDPQMEVHIYFYDLRRCFTNKNIVFEVCVLLTKCGL